MTCNYKTQRLTKREMDKVKMQATNDVFELMLAIPVSVLADKFNFSKEQCEEFTERVFYLMDSYNQGYTDIESLRQTLHEEAGVKVERKR